MKDFEEIAEDEFERRFSLVANHLNDNACWIGCMFETFGEEEEMSLLAL